MELHQNKPAPQVNYSKHMPEIELLMEQLSQSLEEKLNDVLLK